MSQTQVNLNMLDLGGGGLDYRNAIINGNCRVAQRGTTSVVANAYTYGAVDRIHFYNSGFAGGISGSLTQYTGLSTANSPRSGCALRASLTASTGSSAVVQFGTRLEFKDTWRFLGKTVIVSMNLLQDTGAAVPVVIGIKRAASGQDNFTTTSAVASSNAGSVPDNTWTTVSATFNLTYGDITNGLEIYVYFSGLVSFTLKNFWIGDFQMVEGSTVSPIDMPPYAIDEALCMRYYESGTCGQSVNNGSTTTTVSYTHHFKVRKRTSSPTVSVGLGATQVITADGFTSYQGAIAPGAWYNPTTFTANAEL